MCLFTCSHYRLALPVIAIPNIVRMWSSSSNRMRRQYLLNAMINSSTSLPPHLRLLDTVSRVFLLWLLRWDWGWYYWWRWDGLLWGSTLRIPWECVLGAGWFLGPFGYCPFVSALIVEASLHHPCLYLFNSKRPSSGSLSSSALPTVSWVAYLGLYLFELVSHRHVAFVVRACFGCV